jgi:HSP20 family protein
MLTGWREFDDTLRALGMLQRHHIGHLAAWPPTNVLETRERFVVRSEVPGLAESDVSVSVEDDALVIRGERKADVPEGHKVHLRERQAYAFTRKFPLPTRVEADAVTATLKDGVLTVTLPKAKEALPRQVAVKVG